MTPPIEVQKSNFPSAAPAKPESQGGCCGGAAPNGSDSCCALDAEVKSKGGAGCGCGPKTTSGKKGCC